MWWILLYAFLALAGLYVGTAAVFLAVARLEKRADGTLILDPKSRHFKITFPFRKFDEWEVKRLSGRIGLCNYFLRFFGMLCVGWPVLIILAVSKTVFYTIPMLLFGYYPIADLRSMCEEGTPLAVHAGKIRVVPKVKGFKIFPFYFVAPLVYWLCFRLWPGPMWRITMVLLVILIACGAVGVVVEGFPRLIDWLKGTNRQSVSLLREWIKARNLCPLMVIKGAEPAKEK